MKRIAQFLTGALLACLVILVWLKAPPAWATVTITARSYVVQTFDGTTWNDADLYPFTGIPGNSSANAALALAQTDQTTTSGRVVLRVFKVDDNGTPADPTDDSYITTDTLQAGPDVSIVTVVETKQQARLQLSASRGAYRIGDPRRASAAGPLATALSDPGQ